MYFVHGYAAERFSGESPQAKAEVKQPISVSSTPRKYKSRLAYGLPSHIRKFSSTGKKGDNRKYQYTAPIVRHLGHTACWRFSLQRAEATQEAEQHRESARSPTSCAKRKATYGNCEYYQYRIATYSIVRESHAKTLLYSLRYHTSIACEYEYCCTQLVVFIDYDAIILLYWSMVALIIVPIL